MTTSILKPNYKANNYHKLEEEEEEIYIKIKNKIIK